MRPAISPVAAIRTNNCTESKHSRTAFPLGRYVWMSANKPCIAAAAGAVEGGG